VRLQLSAHDDGDGPEGGCIEIEDLERRAEPLAQVG
jgi:hypothetical protein